MHQLVSVAGQDNIDTDAKNALAAIDEAVTRWRRKLQDDSRHTEVNQLLAPRKQQ